jgi:hypothetical protein
MALSPVVYETFRRFEYAKNADLKPNQTSEAKPEKRSGFSFDEGDELLRGDVDYSKEKNQQERNSNKNESNTQEYNEDFHFTDA